MGRENKGYHVNDEQDNCLDYRNPIVKGAGGHNDYHQRHNDFGNRKFSDLTHMKNGNMQMFQINDGNFQHSQQNGNPINRVSLRDDATFECSNNDKNKIQNIHDEEDNDYEDKFNKCGIYEILRSIWIGFCTILLVILLIYFIPFLDIDPVITPDWVDVPMIGMLKASNASEYTIERLLNSRVWAPESIAIDSQGRIYTAVQGGFVLRAKFDPPPKDSKGPEQFESLDDPNVEVLAQLNENSNQICKLDQQLYGPKTLIFSDNYHDATTDTMSETDQSSATPWWMGKKFQKSNIDGFSRCSKPLGVRLSHDENNLYVVDTLQGLFKISNIKDVDANRIPGDIEDLRRRQWSVSPRIVTKMIDWRTDAFKVTHYSDGKPLPSNAIITMKAMDDIVIDEGAGTNGADVIYMSAANVKWTAHEFLYAFLEATTGGYILRYDVGSRQLTVLDGLVSVRMSPVTMGRLNEKLKTDANNLDIGPVGQPKLDDTDIFDVRLNSFWNGLELTDDRQALIIADSANRRIVKHFIHGPRNGQTDLWTWTPLAPDNIRRVVGATTNATFWTAGCGHDFYNKPDIDQKTINNWPRFRKFLLKFIYLVGKTIECFGEYVLGSAKVANAGLNIRIGFAIPDLLCPGMVIVQYNSAGSPIKSIHGPNFPSDMKVISEAHEFVDSRDKSRRILYLGSPLYPYIARISWTEHQ